jgi:hypothetical protein
MSWLLNKKDIEWFKGLFGIKPKTREKRNLFCLDSNNTVFSRNTVFSP